MRTRKKSKPTIDTDVLRRAIHAAFEKPNDADMAADVATYLYQGAIDCQEIGEPASDISLAIYAKMFCEAIAGSRFTPRRRCDAPKIQGD